VLEVNSEDPCLGFIILRDVLDVVRCLVLNVFGGKEEIKYYENGIVPYDKLVEIQNNTEMTVKQIQKVYEIIRLLKCNSEKPEDENVKKLRLDMKRRLRVEHGEDLDALADASQIKEQLQLLYGDIEEHYKVVIEKANTVIAKQ